MDVQIKILHPPPPFCLILYFIGKTKFRLFFDMLAESAKIARKNSRLLCFFSEYA